MSRIAVFFADGCEEIEGLTVVDMLRRANVNVDMVSVMERREIHGSHNITFLADMLYEDMEPASYDGVVLPGGMPGTTNLGVHEGVISIIKEFAAEGKLVSAICAAPSVPGQAGVLRNKRAVCHPGWEDRLTGAIVCEENAMTDGNIITSRGMGTAVDFSLAIIQKLTDEETLENVKKGIVYA